MNELKFATRRLLKTKAFTALTVSTLALGLGASIGAFTLVDSVLLRPLPYRDPEGLVRILAFDRGEAQLEWLSWAEATGLSRESQALEDVAITTVFPATLRAREGAVRVERAFVSFNYFELLGVEPEAGSLFLEGDERQVLLSRGLRRKHWPDRPGIIGEAVELDGELYTVAGVLPDTVYTHDLGSSPADLWLPRSFDRLQSNPHFRIFTVVGRLKPGATREQARQELETIQTRLAEETPEVYQGFGAHADALVDALLDGKGRGLVLLLAAVSLVLLIMLVNLGTLMTSRFLGRRREIATRLALGDRAAGILRDAAIECGLLAGAGSVLGSLLAVWGLGALPHWLPFSLPRQAEIVPDVRLLVTTLGAAALATLLFALVPGVALLGSDVSSALRAAGRGAVAGGDRLRRVVVAVQVALSVPLLIGAGLLTESLLALSERKLGMEPDGLVSIRVSLPPAQYAEPAERVRYFQELLERIRALPGVERAGAAIQAPFVAREADRTRFRFVEEPERPPEERSRALLHVVTDGYFETLGTRLLSGRSFDARDRRDGTPVVIVSEALVRRELGNSGRDPIGLHVETETTMTPEEPHVRQVVGVVEDIPHFGPAAGAEPQMYLPHPQSTFGSMGISIRSRLPAAGVAAETGRIALALEPAVIVSEAITLRDALDENLGQPRFYAQLLLVFAATAAFLACLGLYGLLTFAAASRRQELGIRAALGATPASLVSLLVSSGLLPTVAGVGLGIAISTVAVKFVRSMLYDVNALDLRIFLGAAFLLLSLALASALIPARRAAAMDPVEALRGKE
jgi:predicted permease